MQKLLWVDTETDAEEVDRPHRAVDDIDQDIDVLQQVKRRLDLRLLIGERVRRQ